MNIIQNYFVVNQLIQLCERAEAKIEINEIDGNKVISKFFSLNEIVSSLLGEGLNPLSIIMEETYSGKNKVNTLLNIIWDTSVDDDIKRLFLDKITPENLKLLSYEQQIELVKSFVEDNGPHEAIEVLFNNGFKITQGSDYNSLDMDMALSGNWRYFEAMKEFAPNFNFSKKYKDIDGNQTTLLQTMEEYMLELNKARDEHKRNILKTYSFINDVMKIESHNKLQETLPTGETNRQRQKL